jgi:hypothetical protein
MSLSAAEFNEVFFSDRAQWSVLDWSKMVGDTNIKVTKWRDKPGDKEKEGGATKQYR